jgi:hypothetical protein
MPVPIDEKVYLGRDNPINLILLSDEVATPTDSVTQIGLRIGKAYILGESSQNSTGIIRWGQPTYEVGEVRLYLGGASSILVPGRYSAALIVYDPGAPAGIVWDDELRIQVMPDPTAT